MSTEQPISSAPDQFAQVMHHDPWPSGARHLDIDPDNVRNGLAQLVLTVVKLLHELLERQAIERMDGGGLTEAQIEQLGVTLMRQSEEITRMAELFGLTDDDLNLDLGPLGKLL
ncbi:MAG: gas vesicle protein K [Myxococcota bacterium]